MNNHINRTQNGTNEQPLPAELAGIAGQLDVLAASERGAAALGIEDRVAGASMAALRSGTPVRLVGGRERAARPRTMMNWGLRVAAAWLVAGGALAVYMSISPIKPGSGGGSSGGVVDVAVTDNVAAEQSIDAVLATLASLDSAVGVDDVLKLQDAADGVDWSFDEPILEPTSVLNAGS